MIAKRALAVGGLVVALAVPAGVAVAATVTPSPGPTSTNQPTWPGNGAGHGYGRMMMGGGMGEPGDCPWHDSADAEQWRDQREQRQQMSPGERQDLMEQHREQMHRLMADTATSS